MVDVLIFDFLKLHAHVFLDSLSELGFSCAIVSRFVDILEFEILNIVLGLFKLILVRFLILV